MLQSAAEMDILREYDDKLGCRELRVKIYGAAGYSPQGPGAHALGLSVLAADCYGTHAGK